MASASAMDAANPPSSREDLGLGLKPGDEHYRAFVGPPGDFDLIAAMTFSLLAALGLRQHHRVLDLGCGSLRVGRLLIPYLNRGGYLGVEPNEWLVREGIAREVGAAQVAIKSPFFHYSDGVAGLSEEAVGSGFDFAVAQSVFSHTGRDLLERWLRDLAPLLKPSGALAATYLPDSADTPAAGWVYPGCVKYRPETLTEVARAHGYRTLPLDWRHPRQQWLLLARPDFDDRWLRAHPLGWNSRFDHGPR